MNRTAILLALLLATPVSAIAQNRDPMPGLVKTPPRLIEFDTSEGTWISVDVSKDGGTLVFDLLGDLYTLPASGGDASLLIGGTDFASQPRFSPDGASIAFISDRDGSDNVWIADASGRNLRAVTKENGPLMTSPAWSHDGRHIFVTLVGKTAPRTGELWEFEVATGAGRRVVENTNGGPSGLVSEPPPGPMGAHASAGRAVRLLRVGDAARVRRARGIDQPAHAPRPRVRPRRARGHRRHQSDEARALPRRRRCSRSARSRAAAPGSACVVSAMAASGGCGIRCSGTNSRRGRAAMCCPITPSRPTARP